MTVKIALIAAAAENDLIGRGQALPWRLRADLKHFRSLTTGHPVIMGRKTWISLGKALPNRQNIVLSRSTDFTPAGAECVRSPDEALTRCTLPGPCFIIGGAEIYQLFLPHADLFYLTRVHATPAGDTYLPPIDWRDWQCSDRQDHLADAENEYDYSFQTWQRR